MTAGKDLTIKKSVMGPVILKIGPSSNSEDIYVAPIADNIVLTSSTNNESVYLAGNFENFFW